MIVEIRINENQIILFNTVGEKALLDRNADINPFDFKQVEQYCITNKIVFK